MTCAVSVGLLDGRDERNEHSPEQIFERTPMTTKVWLSLMLQDVTLIKLLGTDKAFSKRIFEERGGDPHCWGASVQKQSDIPTEFYCRYHDLKIGSLPNLVNLGGYMCVSARLKSILEEFDLSGATFHPVQCFEYDRVMPVAGEYYFLNFGRRYDVVNVEKSKGLKKPYPERDVYFISLKVHDDLNSIPVAINQSKTPVTDMWADPCLAESIFLSNRLVERLKKEKLNKLFNLRACEVTETQ